MNSDYVLQRADALVQRVGALVVSEPAARAALRRGVGLTPDDPRMLAAHRVVAPHVPVPKDRDEERRGPVSEWEAPAVERAFYAVAAIMAAQSRSARDQDSETAGRQRDGEASAETPPTGEDDGGAAGKPQKRPNLGASLAEAVFAKGLGADTTEQRLHLLARQNLDGVHRHLPRLVLRLRGDAVDVDWGVLVRDLARWGHSPRQVAKEWVQSYHRTLEALRREAARAKNDTATTEGTEAA